MPDAVVAGETEPKGRWTVRDMPRSVQRWYVSQAVARGLTVAQWLTLQVHSVKALENIAEHGCSADKIVATAALGGIAPLK